MLHYGCSTWSDAHESETHALATPFFMPYEEERFDELKYDRTGMTLGTDKPYPHLGQPGAHFERGEPAPADANQFVPNSI